MNTHFCEKTQTNILESVCHETILRAEDNKELILCTTCAYGLSLIESYGLTRKQAERGEIQTENVEIQKTNDKTVCLYVRVPNKNSKSLLRSQISRLKKYCLSHKYDIMHIYEDVSLTLSKGKSKNFYSLVENIMNGSVRTVVIDKKEVLSHDSFDFFQFIFQKYNCELILRK